MCAREEEEEVAIAPAATRSEMEKFPWTKADEPPGGPFELEPGLLMSDEEACVRVRTWSGHICHTAVVLVKEEEEDEDGNWECEERCCCVDAEEGSCGTELEELAAEVDCDCDCDCDCI